MQENEAIQTRAGASNEERWTQVLRYFDVVLVIVAAVPALVVGVPSLGFLIGAFGWIVQRVLAQLDRRWIRHAAAPRTQLGLNLFEAFGRIWLLAGAIVAAGVIGGRADGLTAALVIFGAYSIAFAIKVIGGAPARPQPARPAGLQAASAAGPPGRGVEGTSGVPTPTRESVLR